MPRLRFLLVGGLGLLAAVGGVMAAAGRFDDRIEDLVWRLETESAASEVAYDPAALADLPEPVARYFETVLEPGQAPTTTVRLDQDGTFNLGSGEDGWHPFTAIQHVSTRPAAFVWDATIEMAPLMGVRVLDCFVGGEGRLRARALSSIPVASAGPSPAMNEGELTRYLAEAVWYPTALLPGNGVEWQSIDDSTARARLDQGDVTASLTFEFDESGLASGVTGDRYRQEQDDYATWVGRFEDYEYRNGRMIPTSFGVGWETEDGVMEYCRGDVLEIEHHGTDPP